MLRRISKPKFFQQQPRLSRQQHREHSDQSRGTTRMSLLRPPTKSSIQKTRDFFWDPEKKSCMTRTPLNWLSITVYYVIFVAVVILAFAICMLVAMQVAASKGDRPQYILDESPIGSSPGMNFFPSINKRALIYLGDNGYKDYVKAINEIFEEYKKTSERFDPAEFNACGTEPYGYDTKSPCIYLRLNRVIAWKPQPYSSTDKLPDNMPKSLTQKISDGDKLIWVSCNGTSAKDRDHFTTDFFDFQGPLGFNPKLYPFLSQSKYLDSIVAFKFTDKPDGVLYSITCKAWGKKLNSDIASLDFVYYFE